MTDSILATLAYFDLFSHPLTAQELYRSLWQPPIGQSTWPLFLHALDKAVTDHRLEETHGYYTLPHRSDIVATREATIRHIDRKLQIAKRAACKLRFVPFIRAVFVCNTVATGTADAASDIDVFIIIRHHRLWIARLLATLTLSVFGLRRHGKHVTDRICLSFYVTDDALNLENIMIPSPDIYLTYWVHTLLPIYDPDSLRRDFMKKNPWACVWLPNADTSYTFSPRFRVGENRWSHAVQRFFSIAWGSAYGDTVEAIAKDLQQKKMKSPVADNTRSRHVIISDTMLKFHEHDRRAEYKEQWQTRLKSLL